jgi:hypothetical protein
MLGHIQYQDVVRQRIKASHICDGAAQRPAQGNAAQAGQKEGLPKMELF